MSQFAASIAFYAGLCVENEITRWWRMRAPCPTCDEQMLLYGSEPALFQGCAAHGFFVDADVVEHTGLKRDSVTAALEKKREDPVTVEEAREQSDRAALARARDREAKEAAERALEETERRLAEARALQVHYAEILRSSQAGSFAALMDELRFLRDAVVKLHERVDMLERTRRA